MKKFFEVLFFRSAFTTKNIGSILIVLALFGVYILAGGKVVLVPKIEQGSSFGSLKPGMTKDNPLKAQPVVPADAPTNVASPQIPVPSHNSDETSDSLSRIEERLKQSVQRRSDENRVQPSRELYRGEN